MEKDREKEDILIDKGATINRLASELEAAQNRLMSGETSRLKEKVLQLTTERNAAKEQVKELGVSSFFFYSRINCHIRNTPNIKKYTD